MKYYKLTCLKELPDVDVGFSFTVSEDALNRGDSIVFEKNNIEKHTLIRYKDSPKFVKVEIDLTRAKPDLLCPNCNKHSLFSYIDAETSEYDDGITEYYKDVGIECGVCCYKQLIARVNTRTRVDYI